MFLVLPGRELAEAGGLHEPRLQVLACVVVIRLACIALFTLWIYTR